MDYILTEEDRRMLDQCRENGIGKVVSQELLDGFTYEGKIYAVPAWLQFSCVAINLDLCDELNLDVPDRTGSPQELAEQAELRAQIEAGLAALPPDYRQVLILRELHQRTYDEIADILSLDLGTVKSRISRGRKQLRKFLLESGNFSAASSSKETGREGCK